MTDAERQKKRDEAAFLLLGEIVALDPMWHTRVALVMEEQHLTPWQIIGKFAAYCLENSLHMVLPQHPAFLPGYVPRLERAECLTCGREFQPEWPGHDHCSNDCVEQWRKTA